MKAELLVGPAVGFLGGEPADQPEREFERLRTRGSVRNTYHVALSC